MFDESNLSPQFAVVLTRTTMLGLERLDARLPLQSIITVSKMAFSSETSCVDVCSAVFFVVSLLSETLLPVPGSSLCSLPKWQR